ncbi:carboxypeptidase-like regulatory domain-containing protein [Flagellimonas halotolerans]|uniref:Carboxypeptidase-like regulatory domain-containing protein n=1 Tax=Flagellimonas halotolerans TaxID=3112164 RepID=A0ABU6IP51_9FLAO|nr:MULTISPECIES: carboxypeptidase-like regulatory domain-containing protein [unclassified Allomuricauda]MEC3964756.1 carboxypeptidase-like regulatory domain-containing protein [Muricauda sp. SYSU M86414]MEC4264880.1 carboxypeptidase-like regulatory domain-containing protein [Muricauda sp. SYSU M84420]
MRLSTILAVLCCCKLQYGQQSTPVTGKFMEKSSDIPISNAIIILESTSQEFTSNDNGEFKIHLTETGEQMLHISAVDYITKRFSLYLQFAN